MSNEEKIKEIAATMRISGFQLNDDDFAMLKDIQNGKLSYDEARFEILREEYNIMNLNPRKNPYVQTNQKQVTINLDEKVNKETKEGAL